MLTITEGACAEKYSDAVTAPLSPTAAEVLAATLSSVGVKTLLVRAPGKRFQVYIPELTAEAVNILNNFREGT